VAEQPKNFGMRRLPKPAAELSSRQALRSHGTYIARESYTYNSNDNIIYDTDSGSLTYDSNGSAEGGSVLIARLAPNLALTSADFFVV